MPRGARNKKPLCARFEAMGAPLESTWGRREKGRDMQIDGHKKHSRLLIVSYSYSGNTHCIAQQIQALTGADWCEIYPWQPYPTAFPELLEQAGREIESQRWPRLLPLSHLPHPYSAIFAGAPIWCGTIAPPLASWLYRNDLAGKTIFPFYSHWGNALGEIERHIKKLCPKADVRGALAVRKDGGAGLEEAVEKWLSGLAQQGAFSEL